MSTSVLEGRVLNGGVDDYSEGDEPVDTGFAGVTVNNYLHYADQAGQVRVAWFGTNDNGTTVTRGSRVSESATSSLFGVVEDSLLHEMWLTAFPVLVRETGASYSLRTKLETSSLNASSTSVRLAVAPFGRAAEYIADPVAHSAATMTATTASTANQTATSLLALDSGEVTDAIVDQQTIDAVGGSPVTVQWALVQCEVWGSGVDLDPAVKSPLLNGLYIAEYHPPP